MMTFKQLGLGLLLMVSGLLFPHLSRAQCPSVVSAGEPAVVFLSVYGLPFGQYFTPESAEFQMGIAGGINIGAILSPGFHIQAGAELYGVKREIDRSPDITELQTYRTRMLEIPVEMRMRLFSQNHNSSQGFFTLGASFALSDIRESNDPTVTLNEVQYQQTFARIGFEHAITVDKKFNILWGLVGKADPLGIADETKASSLNGTYYGGAKIGLQMGF